jgi:predicted dehydrogenase
MNRRQAIKTVVLSAATLTCGASAPAAEVTRHKVGFLGSAHSHALEKFKTVREMTEFEVIGVAEENVNVRESFAKLGATFLNRDELLTKADVVVVESAVRDHARDARDAMRAGRHVHVEKPPAATMREMRELVQLAREKNRLLQVGYMWRHNPGFNKAFEAARNGWLGDVFLVRATMNTSIDAARRPEWAEFKGGAMFEQGCHLIDAVVRLLGAPKRVTPHLQRRGGDHLADNCVVVFEFAKAQAIVTNSVLHPNAGPHRFLEILGTNGVARVQPIEPPSLTLDLAKPAGPYKAGAQKIELPSYRRYVGEFQELAAALRGRGMLGVNLETELVIQEAVLRASEMWHGA